MATYINNIINNIRTMISNVDPAMIALILHMAFLFGAKVLDNMLGTAKTIFIQRGRGVMAAVMIIISDLIYYNVVKEIATTDNDMAIFVVAIASGIGCLLAVSINRKMSKDRTYVHVIMSDNMDAMRQFRDFLAEHHITNMATDSYTLDWSQKTISITAYAETKEQSRFIDAYIKDSDVKFKRVVQKQ